MKNLTLAEVKTLLTTPKHVVIVPHTNPDGDAMGSSLGLAHFLTTKNHNVQIIAPNDYPHFLNWMPGISKVLIFDHQQDKAKTILNEADIIFTLDFNALHRCGAMQTLIEQNKALKIMIDHHQQPEDYAHFRYSDVNMSSTSEMIYHFIDQLGDLDLINSTMGTTLYTGIMTDTASFRFPLSTSTTHRVIAHLKDLGVNHTEIHNNVYDANRLERTKLLGIALNNLKVLEQFHTAYITLSQEELDRCNHQKGDTEGFVNYGLSVENIIFSAIFIENKAENIIKISLRSKGDFDVNQLAREHFCGGGHKNAAGGKSNLSLDDTVAKFETLVKSYKSELQS